MDKVLLIADDNKDIVDILKIYAQKEGYKTVCAYDGEQALKMQKEYNPVLILLDVMMPKINGYDVCRQIRQTSNVPIIMVTAKSEEADRILGLDIGADDYLVKPFGMMEMVSRVKAVLRRCRPKSEANVLRSGGLEINLDEHIVTADGERIELTYKEYELLRLFMQHLGMAFTRDRLFSDVWGLNALWNVEFEGETRTVDMHIRTLRQKLGKYGERIDTVRGVGYRFEKQQ